MQLTDHFTYEEMTHSSTAIRHGRVNTPRPEEMTALRRTAEGLERVRAILGGAAIHVDSAYRSPAVNALVGGSPVSQHCRGEAVDFIAPGFGSPLEICRELVACRDQVEFDQLIMEGAWVHISFREASPRGQVLTAHFSGAGAQYTEGVA